MIGIVIFCAIAAVTIWALAAQDRAARNRREASAQFRQAADLQEAKQRAVDLLEARYRELHDAEILASAPYHGSLILRPGEVVGFGTTAQRILTHKVGHQSQRTTTHSGTLGGQSTRTSAGASKSAGVGLWGVRQGASVSKSGTSGRYTSVHSSTGSSNSYSNDDIRTEVVDTGELIITSQRFVFLGDSNTVEIPRSKILGFHFKDKKTVVVDYSKRPQGECYVVAEGLAMKIAVWRRLREPGFDDISDDGFSAVDAIDSKL